MRHRFAILSSVCLPVGSARFSQGCAMCRSSAEATSKDGRKAISKGVVILLVPPLGIMTVGVWMAFRYGKRRDIEAEPTAWISGIERDGIRGPK